MVKKLKIVENGGMTYHSRLFKVIDNDSEQIAYTSKCAFKKGESCSPDCMFCSMDKPIEPGDSRIHVFCMRDKSMTLMGRIP
jgi:hypothetical protein